MTASAAEASPMPAGVVPASSEAAESKASPTAPMVRSADGGANQHVQKDERHGVGGGEAESAA